MLFKCFARQEEFRGKFGPTTEKSLIIGISQSHKTKKTESGFHVDKYFAFSVLTDSSGLFQRIEVLSEADQELPYLDQLKTSLSQVLLSSAQDFERIVIHTSFKLKNKEIAAIQSVVKQVSTNQGSSACSFAVIKVNHSNRFFGFNREVNSLVPYEGTVVKLGWNEFLVWFEGIYPDKHTVNKQFPGPTHLQFLEITDKNHGNERILLQDLINLSGANWRGFNAKSAPVSVFYCHLVADLVHDFQARGLPLPAVRDLRPWFL